MRRSTVAMLVCMSLLAGSAAFGLETAIKINNGGIFFPTDGSVQLKGWPGGAYFPYAGNGVDALFPVGSIGVGINQAPDASAILELHSTGKGLLIPRMTSGQRTGIGTPANGLMVYDTDVKSIFVYHSSIGWKGLVTDSTITAVVPLSAGATADGWRISIDKASGTTDGYLSAADFITFAAKGGGSVTSVAALTLGTSGTDLSSSVATGTTTPVITLNVPTASASNRGALSAADWTTFNGKEKALTFSPPLSRATDTISLGTVTVANGGTGTTDGSITGTGALTFTASGSDTSINLAPNGAGTVDVSSKKITSLAAPAAATDAANKGYVDGLTGMAWMVKVKDLSTTAPGSPVTGDRYIATANWGVDGGNSANAVGTYDGSAWTFAMPTIRDAVFASTPANGYVFDGAVWTPFSSGSFTGSLAGDVTGTQSATVVAFVGGKAAADVASTVDTVSAATDIGTGGTIVKRSKGGDFTATMITANLTGNVTGNVSGTADNVTGIVAILKGGTGADNKTTALNNLLPAQPGTDGYFLASNGNAYWNRFWDAPSFNTGLGNMVFDALDYSNASNNSGFGDNALSWNTTGSGNTAVGSSSLLSNVEGSNNTAVGYGSLYDTDGNGTGAGSNNIGIGYYAGKNFNDGSYNIAIGNDGDSNDTGTIRIGTPAGEGTGQSTTFIAGIYQAAVLTAPETVVIDANGQLSSVASASGTVTSVSGTTDRISVTNGASTPVVDIAATYVGQTSITTLGTITTGTVPAANVSGLAAVATVGTYDSLTGKPTIPTVGTMASQDAGSVAITGGAISGATLTGNLTGNADTVTNGVYTNVANTLAKGEQKINIEAVDKRGLAIKAFAGQTASLQEWLASDGTTVLASVDASGKFVGDGSLLTGVTASSVPNGVVTTGTYADPAWITSLTGTKITGTVANATAAVTAGSVPNGVVTTGTYANPAWITSLAGTKITGTVAVANGGTGSATKNFVDLATNQMIYGNKTFSSDIAANITGRATGLSATLAISSGGTGETSATAAFNALAPLQTGNSGKFLTSNGADTSWAPVQIVSDGNLNTAGGTSALINNTTGPANAAFGYNAIKNINGDGNTAIGAAALLGATGATGKYNSAVGNSALSAISTGVGNVGLGYGAATSIDSGSYNIAIGYGSGLFLTTGDYNIAIGSKGDTGESATIRIGTAGEQTKAFIAGIQGVTPTIGTAQAVVIGTDGQLGSVSKFGRFVTPPAAGHVPCEQGDFSADASYTYICMAHNIWTRSIMDDTWNQ